MPSVRYLLSTDLAGMTCEEAADSINKGMIIAVDEGPLDVLHHSIEDAIALERSRGMPDHFSRTNGLKFFRVTIEEVE